MSPFEPDTEEFSGRRGWLAPLGFLALSLLVSVMPSPAQQALSSALRGSVLAPFLWVQSSLHEARVLSVNLEQLQSRLDSTQAELDARRTLSEENRRLRALLGLRSRGGPDFVPAAAMRSGTLGSESMFILDVGRLDGVQVNDPVVSSDGLVGVVREVTDRTAVAMDWTHPDFRASAMTVEGDVLGIVEPRRGSFREEDRLLFSGVPYHATVAEGAPVVTSGRGGAYPRGIPLGTISGLAETEAGWRRDYWVDPAARPGNETHVLVMRQALVPGEAPFEELWRPEAESPGQEP